MALSRPAFDAADLNRALDIAAVNPYYPMQDALTMPAAPPEAALARPRWTRLSGAWAIYLQADLTRAPRDAAVPCHRDERDLDRRVALELPRLRRPVAPGGVGARGPRRADGRVLALALASTYGHETYWLGILGHDGEPGRCYDEVAQIAGEFERAGAAVADLVPDADVGRPLLAREPLGAGVPPAARRRGRPRARPPTPTSGSLARFYEGLFGAGLQADVVYAQELGSDAAALVARWPVLVVPALYIADDALLDLLDAYARPAAISCSASAPATPTTRRGPRRGDARPAACRGRRELPRVHEPGGAGAGARGRRRRPVAPGARATAWADALVPEGAETLAGYEHPHLGRWAAVTTHAHGSGRVTYVGTLPDRALAVALAAGCGPCPTPGGRPASVTVTSARNPEAGDRVLFVRTGHGKRVRVALPVAARDLLS